VWNVDSPVKTWSRNNSYKIEEYIEKKATVNRWEQIPGNCDDDHDDKATHYSPF
jgi:hypothetical protein